MSENENDGRQDGKSLKLSRAEKGEDFEEVDVSSANTHTRKQ